MPLFVREHIGDIEFAVWKVEETFDRLAEMLDDNSVLVEIENVKSSRRRLEIIASRFLLKFLCGREYETVLHDENGKPYFASGKRMVSISHTGSYVAVALAPYNIGIDIEVITGRAFRLKEHFLSEGEIKAVDRNDSERDAVLRWSAKESVYKVLGREVYDFKNRLRTEQFSITDDNCFNVYVNKEESCMDAEYKKIYFKVYTDFVLTLCF